jgi:hypothetical protein
VALVVGGAETAGDGVVVPVTAPAMSERVLYDVAVAGGPTVAPHAVYFKREWKSFGLAHVTDTHVARRIDLFRGLLVEAGRPAGAERLVNFNDRFRGFVKYANRLHDQQVLDLIVLTDDLCDYLREVVYEDAAGTPTAPAPEQQPPAASRPHSRPVGRARVHRCRGAARSDLLIPGNHDYRVRPYHLVMDIKDPVVGRFDIGRVTNQQSFDLTIAEAAILTNRLYPKRVRNPATGEMVTPRNGLLRSTRGALSKAAGNLVIRAGRRRASGRSGRWRRRAPEHRCRAPPPSGRRPGRSRRGGSSPGPRCWWRRTADLRGAGCHS